MLGFEITFIVSRKAQVDFLKHQAYLIEIFTHAMSLDMNNL